VAQKYAETEDKNFLLLAHLSTPKDGKVSSLFEQRPSNSPLIIFALYCLPSPSFIVAEVYPKKIMTAFNGVL
jgi:hypothetical protein